MKHSGFTLIECLLYLAIFGVFMSGLIVVLGNLNHRLVERERDFMTLQDQQFTFDKIEWLLHAADVVTVVSASILELQQESESIQLTVTDGRLFILSTSRLPEPISAPYIIIENFRLTEEIIGSERRVMLSYTIGNKVVRHHVYVPL